MRKLRIIFSILWFCISALCLVVAYTITYGGNLSLTIHGANQTGNLGALYLALGVVIGFISIGVYLKNKLALVVIIPLLVFSLLWFGSTLTAGHIWLKHVAGSTLLLALSIGSTVSLWRST